MQLTSPKEKLQSPPSGDGGVIGKYRWTICALVFFATTINYLDRSVISLLKTYLENDFNWTETDYSRIVSLFKPVMHSVCL